MEGYNIWKSERAGTDKGGGGLCMLYRDTLTAHEWSPPVPPKLQYIMNERQWLLIDNTKERCAFLHVYIACQSTRSDSFLQWNEDLFFLITKEAIKLRKQGFIVLAMGDFNSRVGAIPGLEGNTPDTNRNTPMFLNFVNEVNLLLINTLPLARGLFTRYMDNSGLPGTKSLLDYGLIDADHSNTVTSFVIDECGRHDCGSDHAPLECVLEFGTRPKVSWAFQEAVQYNIKDTTDYKQFQTCLDTLSSSIPLYQFSSLTSDQMLPHISESITKSAMDTFGLKVKKRKGGRKLPREIISKIKAKNALARSLHQARLRQTPHQLAQLQQELDILKAEIRDLVSNVRLQRRHRLRSRLLKADPSRKKFWRFLKSQINSAGSISGAYDKTGKMVFNQTEIEEAVMSHFADIFLGKRHPVFIDEALPDQVELSLLELDQILGQSTASFQPSQFEEKVCSPYSFLELDHALKSLPSGKASGLIFTINL